MLHMCHICVVLHIWVCHFIKERKITRDICCRITRILCCYSALWCAQPRPAVTIPYSFYSPYLIGLFAAGRHGKTLECADTRWNVHLLADFSPYCVKFPCHKQIMPAKIYLVWQKIYSKSEHSISCRHTLQCTQHSCGFAAPPDDKNPRQFWDGFQVVWP